MASASQKYANLPDVELNCPDVYETPDVPASFSFVHDSDSEIEENDEASTSILPNAARQSGSQQMQKGNSASSEEAIVKERLKPAESREHFIKSKQTLSPNGVAINTSRHKGGSLLPEARVYSIRNGTTNRKWPLSNTSRRQLRRQLNTQEGDLDIDEAETPTEKLRRLRFETAELEAQLEEQAALNKSKAGDEKQFEEDELAGYEVPGPGDDLPARDDADKTRPPPHRRRKKKPLADEDGQLSPVVLLSQIRRLQGNLDNMPGASEMDDSSKHNAGSVSEEDTKNRQLLQRLTALRTKGIPALESNDSHVPDQLVAETPQASTSRLDERLNVLERFVGAHQADVDEAKPLPAPLLGTLARLEHQIHLLTQPRHLDTISRRVKTLVTDLERVHEARRKMGDTRPLNVALSSGITIVTGQQQQNTQFSTPMQPNAAAGGSSADQALPADALQKIDSLFTLLPRIEPLLPLAPQVLTRLRSLATLHTSATTFSTDLGDSEKGLAELENSEKLLTELLEGVQESLSSNQETMKSNLDSLQGRISSLMSRIDKLE